MIGDDHRVVATVQGMVDRGRSMQAVQAVQDVLDAAEQEHAA